MMGAMGSRHARKMRGMDLEDFSEDVGEGRATASLPTDENRSASFYYELAVFSRFCFFFDACKLNFDLPSDC